MLRDESYTFEDLRQIFLVGVDDLESDLKHLDRSLRRSHERLRAEPAKCASCGFAFRDREPRHFHPPSRCPKCKEERIEQARLHID